MTVKENFIEFIERSFTEFEVVGEYVKETKEVNILHKTCGKTFNIRPSYFREVPLCIKCMGNPKTQEEYIERVNLISNNEYEVLSDYVKEWEKVLKRHKVCGYEWEIAPGHFRIGRRCPKCSGRVRKDTKYFVNEILELVGDEYEVMTEYEGAFHYVYFKHNSERCDNNVFKMTPSDFLQGRRCPKCGQLNKSGIFHWNYNPNLTEEQRQRRDMFNVEIRKWRDKVYARDNYTCQRCSAYGGELNAHHLNSWDKHPEERFDLTNGITLCVDCHKQFHSLYGYGNNTHLQYIEYSKTYL